MNLYQFLQKAGLSEPAEALREIELRHEPWDHQLGDMKHILKYVRFGIWNDAGTGKTIPMQASATMYASLGNKVIAVMPPSLIGQWVESYKKDFIGVDKLLNIHALTQSKAAREKLFDKWRDNGWPDVLVMSYDTFRNLHPIKTVKPSLMSKRKPVQALRTHPLNDAGYNVLIFDEAHKLKNASATVHKVLWKWVGTDEDNYSLQLYTGSPIPNTLSDAYGMVRLVYPPAYRTKRAFEQRHCEFNPYSDFREIIGYKNIEELYQNLYKRGRRVTKQEVLKNLPPMLPIECPIKLGREHKRLYTDLVTQRVLEYDGQVIDATHSSKFRQLALQLISNPEHYTENNITNELDIWLDNTLESIGTNENKVIIFCYFRQTVERLMEKYEELNPACIYGGTQDQEAERVKFVEDESCRAIILNLDSGGVGLNLQNSSYVIFYEPPLTPMQAQQGIARSHRGGQMKAVRVYVPRVTGTIASQRLSKLLDKEAQNNAVVRDKHKLLNELLGKD